MKWFQFCRYLFTTPSVAKEPLSSAELELCLNKQIVQGDIFGCFATLKILSRQLIESERVTLIHSCLGKRKFVEAFYLTRQLLQIGDKKELLDRIAREAAFADDYSTARAAALLSGRIGGEAS